jgi:hypothetical protein
VRWLAAALIALAALALPGGALAEEAAPSVEPLVLELTLRPDGGVDGELRATWRAGAAPIGAIWKSVGHGARVLAVTDVDANRPLAYTTTLATHEARLEVALERPIEPGGRRAVAIRFDQTHVWHYDPATQVLMLNVPWVMSWDVGVRDVVQRVHVPPELGPMPEPGGWQVDGRTLIARRAEGAPRLTLQMPLPPEAVAVWTAPLLATVPGPAWLGLALLVAAPIGWRLRPGRGRDVGQTPELSAAATATLLAPGDDRVLVEACLLTLVERGAIELRATDDGDVEVAERPAVGLGAAEARWREQLLAGAEAVDGQQRRVRISAALERGLHLAWRAEVESDLGRAGLLEAEQSPGLDGLSYAGWAARERLRRELRASVGGGPGLAATAGLAAAALAIGVGAGALATLPAHVELEGQQYAVGSIVFDGTAIVRLRYTLARLLPLPASHSHDYAENCGNGCGMGFFVGDHSCASSCGGVA